MAHLQKIERKSELRVILVCMNAIHQVVIIFSECSVTNTNLNWKAFFFFFLAASLIHLIWKPEHPFLNLKRKIVQNKHSAVYFDWKKGIYSYFVQEGFGMI
jgi:hypothetical protein